MPEPVGPVQFVERRVECRRLAGTGRPGHQEDPVRPFDDLLEPNVILLAEAEVADVDLDVAPVQNPHDRRLTVN